MSLKQYEQYKDTGVDWLGEIPLEWEVKTLKHIVSTPITDGPHETPNFIDEGIPFVSAEAVATGIIDFSKIRGFISKEDHWRYSQKYLPQLGDIYMVKSGATTGITAIVETDLEFNIWSPLAALRCNDQTEPRFLLYFMRSKNFQEAVTLNWSFGTQQNIGMGVIENLVMAYPPFQEQTAITDFLDRETGKIDALVAEQRRLIELLKEKRQAVISHAVTKGLNPDAPMKDSGIEWLGEVPAHWTLRPLKHLATFKSGGTPDKARLEYWDGDIPWASAKDLKVQVLEDTEDHITKAALNDGAANLINPGSILVVVRGMILARMFPVVLTKVPLAINQDLKAVIPKPSLCVDFLAWLLRGTELAILSNLDEAAHGTKALRMDRWGSMLLPVPPLAEQIKIAAYVEQTSVSFQELLQTAEQTIFLLQERRNALISAAVTGKIDVRESLTTNTFAEKESLTLCGASA